MDVKSAFELKRVKFGYQREDTLFEDLNLKIMSGERISLLGANGSGKSTLLKLLCGLVFADQGSFYAFGEKITDKTLENEMVAKAYHRRIGFVFQNSDVQLFTTRVWDEIAFGPLQLGYEMNEVKKRVEDVMQMLTIGHLRDKSPYRLSGGEKKKVAVATILVLNPEVLIFDEPTNGLDPKTQHWLVDLLNELNRNGHTIITATHNLELAHAISDRAVVLSETHQIAYDGPATQALDDHQLLISVNLIDEFHHRHGEQEHVHRYTHG